MSGWGGPYETGQGRRLRDQATVELQLPAATREVSVEGVRGWLYPVTSGQGDLYELFLWFDGSGYQVKVVSPVVERHPQAHACHLFPDARICLGEGGGGGLPTLADAYAKSVLWANGYSMFLRTSRFPY